MGTAEVLLDTDVLVDHLRGARRVLPERGTVAVSVITRCQLFAGSDASDQLCRLLAAMVELPVDAAIAELAGVTRRHTGIATPDALIAATALSHGIPLMTRNRRHFDRVDDLRIVAPH